MSFLKFFLFSIIFSSISHVQCDYLKDLILPGERHFSKIRQLTFGGDCAEAYFSRDDRRISFQASNFGYKCDQIFKFDLDEGDTRKHKPTLVSTGLGRTTCSFFLPDNQRVLYASTHLGNRECPLSPCKNQTALDHDAKLKELCNSTYIWDVFSDFDIFIANANDVIVKRLTATPGYDAEGTISPDGERIVFTSMRSGDLELWTMNLDGSNLKQITNELGYDGGAFFSPDSKKLVFRASRPTGKEAEKYKALLSYNMVSPTSMELYTANADATDMKKVTNLGGANWAPYYHPSGEKIIFSSNYKNPEGFGFNLFMINADGTGTVEQIANDTMFDSFPMFSYDGRQLIFGSMRNSTPGKFEVNVFLADWID